MTKRPTRRQLTVTFEGSQVMAKILGQYAVVWHEEALYLVHSCGAAISLPADAMCGVIPANGRMAGLPATGVNLIIQVALQADHTCPGETHG